MFPLGPFSKKSSLSHPYQESPHDSMPPIQPMFSRQHQSLPLRYHQNEIKYDNAPLKVQENKSFLDNFESNNSSLLNQQKNHARNLRGRLFSNQDPQIQKAKEDKMKAYKEQLLKQIEAEKIRKQKEKRDLEEEQIRREKKFYENLKIEAQQKANDKEGGNAYYMMRTGQKKEKSKTKLNNFVEETKPKISKKAYKNQRLDESRPKKPQLDESQVREKSVEEERIAKILLFQENMLKKLDSMKVQIRNTNSHLEVDQQIERVRFKLRSHPIHFNRGNQKPQITFNNFYSLPKRNVVKVPKVTVRLSDKKRGLSKNEDRQQKTTIQSRQVRRNDKNFEYEEENPQQQAQE